MRRIKFEIRAGTKSAEGVNREDTQKRKRKKGEYRQIRDAT